MINNLPSLQPDLFPPSENPQEDPRRLCILGLSEFLMLKKFINGEKKKTEISYLTCRPGDWGIIVLLTMRLV